MPKEKRDRGATPRVESPDKVELAELHEQREPDALSAVKDHLGIPPELVPLLRDGLYFDLTMQVTEIDALIEPLDRGDIGVEVGCCLARAESTRALLDVTGWAEPEDGFRAVDVNMREHHEAPTARASHQARWRLSSWSAQIRRGPPCAPSQRPSTYRSQSWAPRSKRRTPPRRRCRDVSARHPSHRPPTATLAERSSDSRNRALR
jgi:hypothetical protein